MHNKKTTALFVLTFIFFSPLCYAKGGSLLPSKYYISLDKETLDLGRELWADFLTKGVDVRVPVNVSSEDGKKALEAAKVHVNHEISVPRDTINTGSAAVRDTIITGSAASMTIGSFGLSLYKLNGRQNIQDLASCDLLIPATLAVSGFCYLLWSNDRLKKEEAKAEAAQRAYQEAQKAESNALLAKAASESKVESEETKKETALKGLSDTGSKNANRATIGS